MFEKINLLIPFGNFVRNKSLQNFLFLALIQSSTILISLISMPLLIQSIGAEQFGWVNLSFSVIIVFNILVGFGFNLNAPREVALNQSNKEALSQLVSNVFSAKILLAVFSTVLILIGAYGLNLFQGYQTVLVLSVFLLFSEATFPLWFFQGMEKMKLISIANVFSKLLYLLGIVLFIRDPEQSKWVNFILGASGLGINILLLIYIHYSLDIKFYKPRFLELFTLLKNTGLLLLSNIVTHFSINGTLVVLSFFASATTLGLFSLAERISMVLRMFPAMVIHSIFPNASKLLKEDLSAFISYLKKVSFVALVVGLTVSLAVFGLAPFIIQLFSKAEFVDSISYLKILAFIPFLACLNIMNVVIFLVNGQNNLMFKSSWMMGLFMVSNSIFLTSHYGAIGLCYAMLSTEIVVFLICCVLNWVYNRPLILAILKLVSPMQLEKDGEMTQFRENLGEVSMEPNSLSKVAIVIVNWNGYELTKACLESLKELQYSNFQIVLVDNGSVDGSGERLKSEFSAITLLTSPDNIGFTGGNNLGIQWALDHFFDQVLLLNNDTLVEPDFLDPLVSFLEQNPDYGAVQPKIMFEAERDKLWNAGGGYFKGLEMTWSIGIGQLDEGQFDQEKDTPWITGCAILVSSSAIRKAGMLDNRFFAYYEDVEWSFRIKKSGFRLRYLPQSKIYHVAGGSSKKIKTKEGIIPPILHYYRTRNHLFLIRSHSNPVTFVLSLLYQTLKNAAFILYLGLNGRFQKVNAILKGHYEGLFSR